MSLGTYRKQPADERDVDIDCADWLDELGGDTLASASVTSVAPSGLTVDSPVVSDTSLKAWVRGGDDGADYVVTLLIVTTGGRKREVEFKVKVKDR